MAVPAMIPPPATHDFLVTAGWTGADVQPLAGDASFRRYFRVLLGGRSAVLMDAPPPHEDPRPFITMAEFLAKVGLCAPRILHHDLEQGLLLIEDLGSDRMREAVDADPASELLTYSGLIDVLVTLHRHSPAPGLAHHDLSVWLDEVMLLTDWYGPAVGLDLPRDSFRAAWQSVLEPVERDGLDRVTILRDFHAENIMLIAGGTGVGRYGLLDFQDALAGHPAYDLASVLEDARRDVTPEVEWSLIDAYVNATGRDDRFERAYWSLAAQRNTRILGVFCRLWKRDGKAHYTSFQPRMWGLLERDLAHPHLAPVKAWFDEHIPAEKRAPIWSRLP
ncbi:phosphotransferase [Sphingomonas lacunae]|uniref:Phosphotransferase n=1 Tax=Sphingomonas lacunae TaxID=2698828 RepID=A0A6M4AW98_9SPHN|nr:phosphotransferase [Sphingomonas lacunae]QJQ33016.1 phosphotransferase [Sphingomonas lacunae]